MRKTQKEQTVIKITVQFFNVDSVRSSTMHASQQWSSALIPSTEKISPSCSNQSFWSFPVIPHAMETVDVSSHMPWRQWMCHLTCHGDSGCVIPHAMETVDVSSHMPWRQWMCHPTCHGDSGCACLCIVAMMQHTSVQLFPALLSDNCTTFLVNSA